MNKYIFISLLFFIGCCSIYNEVSLLQIENVERAYLSTYKAYRENGKKPGIGVEFRSSKIESRQFAQILESIILEIKSTNLIFFNEFDEKSDINSINISITFYLTDSRLLLDYKTENDYAKLVSLDKESVAKSLRPASVRYIDLKEYPKLKDYLLALDEMLVNYEY